MKVFLRITLVTLLVGCGSIAADDVVLLQDGRASSTIVLGENDGLSGALVMGLDGRSSRLPEGNLGVAAQALADHLNEMAQIAEPSDQIRVVEDVREVRTPYRILLGSAAIEEYELHEEAATLPYWSYIYRTEGDDLLIFGSSTKGAANGVYGFMQDELGVRWFGPGDLFRILPAVETIRVAHLDHREDPDFTGRFSMSHLFDQPQGVWANRMRVAEPGRGEALPYYFRPHTLKNILPVEEFGDRPELYNLRGGRRFVDPSRFGLCYSNPEVVEITVDHILDYFRGGDHRHTFSLGMNDYIAYCECEECAKLQPERNYMGAKVASDMWWHYVNEVARPVRAEFPDRYIGTGASKDITVPPLAEVEDNVFVVLLNDVSEFYDADFRAREHELLDMWEEKGNKMGMYYYTGLAKLVPAYFPRMLADELKDRKGRGYVVMYTEAHPGWPWTGPMHYVQARLWWDVGLDPDQLLGEYFTLLYGPAAPYMSDLYELFEEIHLRPRSGGVRHEHYNFAQFRPYTAEDLERMRELIDGAHGSLEVLSVGRGARENVESQRLAYVTGGLRLFLEMLEGVVLARELDQFEVDAENLQAMEALRKVERINELLTRHIRVYREAIISDSTHSSRFLHDTVAPVRNSWNRYLSTTQGQALAKLNAVRDQLGPRTAGMLDRQIEVHTEDPGRRIGFLLETGQVEFGDNLARNPGFEEIDEEGIPANWGRTPPRARGDGYVIDTVEHSRPDPRFGERSGRMKGITENAYYLNGVRRIEPGQPYLFEVDMKMNVPHELIDLFEGEAYMRVDWRGAEAGVIRGEHQFEVHLDAVNEWVTLRTAAIAPEGAEQARVFLRAGHLRGEEEVWFDNLSVRPMKTLD